MKLQHGLLAVLFAVTAAAQAEQPAAETGAVPAAATQSAETNATSAAAAPTTGQAKAEEPMTEQAGFSTGSVVRSAITSSVENREPTDSLDKVSNEQNQLYFFTELRDMSGQTAKHRWEHDGKVMAEVEFNVKGPRWRVWSSKSFVPNWTGDWKVSVINGAGDVISEKTFTYETAAAEQAAEPATPAVAPAAPAGSSAE